MTSDAIVRHRQQAFEMLDAAGIVLTDREQESIEIADLGLGEFESSGLALVVYINTARVCAEGAGPAARPDLPAASSSACWRRTRKGRDVPLSLR